ncbi:MAG: 2-oxoacid:acceptor oxidoreductase family protein [Thermaerobacter sp.]|nr:2-oxoacid:acceptor oxidoreductase family protein [Thermaerobacter sp.]
MLEIRWHGRGGQGAKTASQLLAVAFLKAGRFVQAFPEYGPERTGAPILAYTRVDEQPIRAHSAIIHPNLAVVLDPSLLREQHVTDGLSHEGLLVVNSGQSGRVLEFSRVVAPVLSVPGDDLAKEAGSRHTNTVMTGVISAWLGEPSLDQLLSAADEVLARLSPPLRAGARAAIRLGFAYGLAADGRKPEAGTAKEGDRHVETASRDLAGTPRGTNSTG